MTARLPDESDRRRAASDFDVNLLVRAGAGTGKTELLVERILTAIGSGKLEIGQLAALTFTEKAAGEMRERLAVGLERLRSLSRAESNGAAGGAPARALTHLTGTLGIAPHEIALRALTALRALDRARITTIHSFCSDLLRTHPREANVDPMFRVDAGEHFRAIFDDEWTRFLASELGPAAARGGVWSRLLYELGAAELRAIAMGLASFSYPQALLSLPYEPQNEQALLTATVQQLLNRLRRAAAATGLTATNVEFLAAAQEALNRFEDAGVEGMESCFASAPDRRERILTGGTKMGTKVAGIARDEFESIVSDTRRTVRALLAVHDELIGRTVAALAPFARRFRQAYLARGLVSFDGLLHLARDLLAEHPEVRRAIRRTFRMILVDEFQDTDPVQYELVLFLAESDDGRATDAFEAELAPGRLFVVGDAKQSIYRFRGADYEAFRRAADRIVEQGGAHAGLTTNFRSVPGVLDAVHRLFGPEGTAWRESRFLPAYEPVEPHREDSGPAVEVWTVTPRADGARARREAEGMALAERIRTWVEGERACGYGDITVLFRSFTQLSLYLKPLRKAGIPFIVDGGRGFVERPEVGQLLAILRALASPADPVALLTYLRSPAGGVPDTELAGHAASGGAWDWREGADAERFPALGAALRRLRELAESTRHLPIDARIRAAISATDLLPLSAASYDGAQRVANLRKLARLASNLARDGKLSTGEILNTLEDEQISRTEADSPLADDAADAVRILTIHKAKGLENRRVILADVAREDRPQRDTVRVRVARIEGRSRPAILAGSRMNAARALLNEEERRHDAAEETRVLYVALTRARDRLSVFLGPARGSALWLDAFRAWGYDPDAPPPDGATIDAGRILHRVLVPREVEALDSRDTASVDEAVTNYRTALAALGQYRRGTRRTPSDDERTAGAEGGAGDRARARAAGTAVHELLRRFTLTNDADLLKPLREIAESAALAAGVAANAVVREVEEIVAVFLRSELPARLRRARILGREMPMILNEEGTFWTGSIDLLMEEAGEIVVVDFKTGREADAAALTERYRPQLAVYRRAVQTALALPNSARAELWLVRRGTAVPVL